jgi:hypothetical protein
MRIRHQLALCVVPLFAGCFMSSAPPEEPPVTEPPVTEPPVTGLAVEAVIAAAYLGDSCGSDLDGDCAIDSCGCAMSSMQLRFTTAEDYGDLSTRIVRVALHAFESGDYLQDLAADQPATWDDTLGYTPWDEVFVTPAELNVSYGLEAPAWDTIYGRYESPWSMSYQLRVTVEIAGEERTLLSGEVYRISDIDT